MNSRQLAQQIRHLLTQITWPTGDAEVLFGMHAVRIIAGAPRREDIPPQYPWAMVVIDSAEHDDDQPELVEQAFQIVIGVEVFGDDVGEAAVVGGPVFNLGSSQGKGLAEIAARVRQDLAGLTGSDGVSLTAHVSASSPPQDDGDGTHFAVGALILRAFCTSAPFFDAPQQLRNRAGSWTWAGERCKARFDFVEFALVRKAGGVPNDPDDGIAVYNGTDSGTFHAAVAGSGYAVFAKYDARGMGIIEGSSAPEVGSTYNPVGGFADSVLIGSTVEAVQAPSP